MDRWTTTTIKIVEIVRIFCGSSSSTFREIREGQGRGDRVQRIRRGGGSVPLIMDVNVRLVLLVILVILTTVMMTMVVMSMVFLIHSRPEAAVPTREGLHGRWDMGYGKLSIVRKAGTSRSDRMIIESNLGVRSGRARLFCTKRSFRDSCLF